MKRLFVSGGLLAGEFFAQTGKLLIDSESGIGAGLLIAGWDGLAIALRHFSNDLFSTLTEHGETFTV